MSIYKALTEINKGITAIGKNRTNQQQGFKFRGIDDVMNELHSLFAENEVIILPEVLKIDSTERTNKSGGILFCVKVSVRFDFVHSSGEKASCILVGEAMDSGDKAVNKAMSIALKYALLQMFLIPTEEDKDPDTATHEVKQVVKKESAPPESSQTNWLEMENALEMIGQAQTIERLTEIWNTFKTFQKEKDFTVALARKKAEIKNLMV
jgi:hypothetical protein